MILLEELTEEQQIEIEELFTKVEPIEEVEYTLGNLTRILKRIYENDKYVVEQTFEYVNEAMHKEWAALTSFNIKNYAK